MINTTLSKKAFDLEYSTQTRDEYEYLHRLGFRCSYMKRDPRFGVMTYKYKKTSSLFKAVADFYEQRESERSMRDVKSLIDNPPEKSVVLNATEEEVNAMFSRLFDRSRSGQVFTTDDLPNEIKNSLASLRSEDDECE